VNAATHNENFSQQTALQGACEFGREDIVSLLLAHNADPNLGGGEDSPPIVAAAMYGEEKILMKLIDAKADVNVFGGDDDSTPLINAAACIPGLDALQKLLDAGADINLSDSDGNTALITASEIGDEEAVQFLLSNGADIMHLNKSGQSAIQVALKEQEHDCVEILVKHISIILAAVKEAMDSGNAAVISVVRKATASTQELNYDDISHGDETPTSLPRANARGPTTNRASSEYSQDAYEQVESYTTEVDAQSNAFEHTQTTMAYKTTSSQSYDQPPMTPPPQVTEQRSYQQMASVQQNVQILPLRLPDQGTQERNQSGYYAGRPGQGLAEQQSIKRKPAPIVPNGDQYRLTPPPNPSADPTTGFQPPVATYAAYRPGVETTPSRRDQPAYNQILRHDSEPIPVSKASPAWNNRVSHEQNQSPRPNPRTSSHSLVQDISLYDGSQYGSLAESYDNSSLRDTNRYGGPTGPQYQPSGPQTSQSGSAAYPAPLERPYPQKSYTSPSQVQQYQGQWGNQERPSQANQHPGYSGNPAVQYQPVFNKTKQMAIPLGPVTYRGVEGTR
jgi:hypothetical protein